MKNSNNTEVNCSISNGVFSQDVSLIVAKPNYCIPATVNMVLNCLGCVELTQDSIARCFDVNTDPRTPENSWGISATELTVNRIRALLSVPLYEKYISINLLYNEYDLEQHIFKVLHQGALIICGYNYSALWGGSCSSFNHASVINAININEGHISLADPGPEGAGFKQVCSTDLYYAIKRGCGFLWCISRKPFVGRKSPPLTTPIRFAIH